VFEKLGVFLCPKPELLIDSVAGAVALAESESLHCTFL
jgi:hypothetical protein